MNLPDIMVSERSKHKNIHNKLFFLCRQKEIMVLEVRTVVTFEGAWGEGAQARL